MLGAGALIMVAALRRRHLEGLELDPAAMPVAA
jgi:hypothetical protein